MFHGIQLAFSATIWFALGNRFIVSFYPIFIFSFHCDIAGAKVLNDKFCYFTPYLYFLSTVTYLDRARILCDRLISLFYTTFIFHFHCDNVRAKVLCEIFCYFTLLFVFSFHCDKSREKRLCDKFIVSF